MGILYIASNCIDSALSKVAFLFPAATNAYTGTTTAETTITSHLESLTIRSRSACRCSNRVFGVDGAASSCVNYHLPQRWSGRPAVSGRGDSDPHARWQDGTCRWWPGCYLIGTGSG